MQAYFITIRDKFHSVLLPEARLPLRLPNACLQVHFGSFCRLARIPQRSSPIVMWKIAWNISDCLSFCSFDFSLLILVLFSQRLRNFLGSTPISYVDPAFGVFVQAQEAARWTGHAKGCYNNFADLRFVNLLRVAVRIPVMFHNDSEPFVTRVVICFATATLTKSWIECSCRCQEVPFLYNQTHK